MLPVVTAEEMRELDRTAIEKTGISGEVLMENAAIKVVLAIEEACGALLGRKIFIFCGKGNNGGDGLAIARHLINRGALVNTCVLSTPERISGDAKTNLGILASLSHKPVFFSDSFKLSKLKGALWRSDIIIDAMLGTGLQSAPSAVFCEAIDMINSSGKFVVAVDIPSGLSSDTGVPIGDCVKSNLTVSLGFAKRGFFSNRARDFTGKIKNVDISIPRSLVKNKQHKVFMLTPNSVKTMLGDRPLASHKGSFGHVLVVAGSKGKTGAASMSAVAAARAGAGLVTLAVPESLEHILEVKTTEVMTEGLAECQEGYLGEDALYRILELAETKTVVVLGPGLSTSTGTKALVAELVRLTNTPLVIDADGLNSLAGDADILRNAKAPVFITPHPGEMGRLMKISTEKIEKERFRTLTDALSKLGVNIILKGYNTLISGQNGEIFINPTGNPGMATGGTGDILSGFIAAFLGQTEDHALACCAATYLHGLAGDMAKDKLGEISLMANDILNFIPDAVRQVKSSSFQYDPFLFSR